MNTATPTIDKLHRSWHAGLAAALLLAACTIGAATEPAPTAFTAEDLVRVKRLSGPQTSPDGRYLAYVLRKTDINANRGRSDLYLLDLEARDAVPRQLTTSTENDSEPRWAPDSTTLYFLSTRSGSSQVWRLSRDGGEAAQVTDYPLDVNALKVSPDGRRLALSIDVFPDCNTLACSHERFASTAARKTSGRIYDQLFIRHWDRWEDGAKAHLFTVQIDAAGKAGEPVDVMKGVRANVPSRPTGGDEEFNFTPDSREIVYSARMADGKEPWSTNFDLYRIAVDGSGAAVNLTADNPAWDTQPVFLADGSLAYLAMDRPGFEADRFEVMLRDAKSGITRSLTHDWDQSVSTLAVTRDGRNLLATADAHGQVGLYSISRNTGAVRTLLEDGQITGFSPTRKGIVIALASLDAPPDLYLLADSRRNARPSRLTAVNATLLEARFHVEAEQFSFAGAEGETVSGHVIKPFGYVAGRRYPIAFVIHGGPQVAFGNAWSYRWNPKTIAGAGYAVVFIDFHGTPGYGQKFTDSISQDWGGKPLVDLQKGLAAAIDKYPFLDGDNACALGASYGGYMVNWIAGNWPDRFRCLVNHDGVFDSRAMYYTTEELWFDEWEHGGPYFEVPANFEKFNPANHVTQWRTPMLVVQGEQDFRIPDTQGIGTFTALQRRGIKSRLLYFPDENHWVNKPGNSLLWYATVLGWLDEHLKGGASR